MVVVVTSVLMKQYTNEKNVKSVKVKENDEKESKANQTKEEIKEEATKIL